MGELEDLREKCKDQAREIRLMQEVLERKNRELDAAHFIWCDGGCVSGVHRWTCGIPLTEEVLKKAQMQVARMEKWRRNALFRLTYGELYPGQHQSLREKLGISKGEGDEEGT